MNSLSSRSQNRPHSMPTLLYYAIFNMAFDGICIIRKEGHIFEANPSFCKRMGYTRNELIGLPIKHLIHPEHQHKWDEFWPKIAIDQEAQVYVESLGVCKNGKIIASEIASSLLIVDGESMVLTIVRDITERRKNQDHELLHFSRLSIAGEMATGMAHELNQPLTAITNYTRGCIKRLEMQPSKEELAPIMNQVLLQTERAANIIHRMRLFVKKGETIKRAVNINNIVLDSVHLFDFELEREKINLRSQLAAKLPPILADQVQLSQVFVNIIKNAIEVIAEERPEKKEIFIKTNLVSTEILEISIRNSGKKVDPEISRKFFDRFFTTKKQGMGMGLAISRTIIEAHGGYLFLDEDNNTEGTCFKIHLPIVA